MKTYEKYKPSGFEFIGNIPEKWESSLLKRFCYVTDGSHYSPKSQNSGKPYVSVKDIGENCIDLENCNKIADEDFDLMVRNGCCPIENDVLLTKDGTIGRAAIITKEYEPFVVLSSLGILSPTEKVNSRFLYFYLTSGINVDQMFSTIRGSALTRLTIEKIKNLIFVCPSIPEQTAIADYLDEKTAEIDKLIANKKRLIELLKEERTAIINQAVTKGINANAKLKPSGIDWLGDIPEHWEVKKLKFLLKANKGAMKTGPFGSHIKNSDFFTTGDYKVYNQRNVLDNDFEKGEDFLSESKFNELKGFEVFENDVLVTTRGTIGKCAIFPEGKKRGVLHPCLIRFQPDQDKILNDWIKVYFNESSHFLENVNLLSNSTTIEVIYSYNLKEVSIPLPNTKEQKEIVEFIESKTNEIDSTISKIEKEIELIKEYRTALISEMVTGKIKVF